MILLCNFVNAQLNFFEGFESGTIPANLTYVGTVIGTNFQLAKTGSFYAVMPTTIGSNTRLTTPSLITDGTAVNISVQYRKFSGTGIFMGLRYYVNGGTTPTPLLELSAGPNVENFTYLPLTAIIPANTLAPGTSIRIELYVFGQNGTSSSVIFDDFTAFNQSSLIAPTITVNSVATNTASAAINYSINANNAATTSIVRYGTVSTNLASSISGFSAIGNQAVTSETNITGLTTGVQYFYRIEATNSQGTAISAIGNFTTGTPIPTLITQYNFNGTYTNLNNNTPFAANAGTSFVTDRNGNANSALNINSTGTTATIPALPYNNAARTISVWTKLNAYSGFNYMFSYGSASNSGAQSGNITRDQINYFGYFTNIYHDLPVASYNQLNTWYHFVYVYDGTTARIYKNGNLVKTQAITWNTLNNNNIFKLGMGIDNELTFNGTIDDLKIYNYAISDLDVASLFANNTLSSQDFKQNDLQLNLYPNPANNFITIEMTNQAKSIEIYTILGQKVLESKNKQINVSSLAAGMYMVRIKDSENATSTKKFIKN